MQLAGESTQYPNMQGELAERLRLDALGQRTSGCHGHGKTRCLARRASSMNVFAPDRAIEWEWPYL